jgi:hypothetical protein
MPERGGGSAIPLRGNGLRARGCAVPLARQIPLLAANDEEAYPALFKQPTNDCRKLVPDILGETIPRKFKIKIIYDDRATIVGKREAKCLKF